MNCFKDHSVWSSTDWSHVFAFPVGAAYARAEEGIRKLVEQCKLPFLPTPMGKGVIPDNHPNCVAAARSRCVAFRFFKYKDVAHFRLINSM